MRYEYHYPDRTPILILYRATEFAGDPQNLDFEEFACVERESMRDYDFLEGDAEFIRNY